jgi:pimeloyl-ACP methyl ester carboxylesterase
MRELASIVVIGVAVYAAICALMYGTQRSQIYFPTPASEHAGTDVLWVETGDARIKVWAVRRPGSRALIYFGGNAEDVRYSIDELSVALPESSLYLVNYRGYGGSSGRPSEAALYEDALAICDRVREERADVDVMGRSLGSAVAVHLASERLVRRLVLVTPFDSLAAVAQHHFRWLPVGLLMRDRYDSSNLAQSIRAPTLMIVAAQDEIVDRKRSDALAQAFQPGWVRVELIEGARHNTLDRYPRYLEAVQKFLSSEQESGIGASGGALRGGRPHSPVRAAIGPIAHFAPKS